MPVEEATSTPHASAPGLQEWERTYAMWTHLLLLTLHVGVPVVPSLILWLVKRDQSSYVDDHGKEAVNFQLSLLLYGLISVPLMFICIGYVTAFAAWVLGIVGMILAAVAANRGQYFRYPMSIRLIR